jgi:uncharacterized membrane protein YciS (DUF1049 family)
MAMLMCRHAFLYKLNYMEHNMKILSYILLIVLLVLGVSFAGLNASPVTINYYIGARELPLSLLLVMFFAFGCALGLLVGLSMYLRMRSKNYRLSNRIKLAEKEVSNLRNMPLQDNR